MTMIEQQSRRRQCGLYLTFIIAPVLVPFESGDASCRCNSASKSLSPKIPLSWLVAMIGSLFPFTG